MAATGNPSRGARPGSTRRLFELLVVAIAVCTIVGLIALWPGDVDAPVAQGLAADTERAEVESVTVTNEACALPEDINCGEAEIRLETGPDEGDVATILLGVGFEPDPGDTIRVVIAFGRLRGALSLVGLAISLAVILAFIVPAILDGSAPLAVAIIGSLAVMLPTVSLAHGWNAKSLAAMIGTAISLALVALLALAFSNLAHLTGLSSEEGTLLLQGGPEGGG